MKRFALCVAAAVGLCLLAGTVRAEDAGDQTPRKQRRARKQQEAGKHKRLRGRYAVLAKELSLTEEQIARMHELVEARNRAIAEVRNQSREKAKQLKAQIAEAREAGSEDQAKRFSQQAKALQAERKKAEREYDEKILAVLTPEQQQQWQSHQVSRKYLGRFRKLELTDDQKRQMQEIIAAEQPRAEAAENRKGRAAVEKELREKLESVLTDEQKQQLSQPRARKGEKADKPARPDRKVKRRRGGSEDEESVDE